MKPFLFLIGLAVLGAIAAPFFLTIKGQPLMTVDEALDDATPNLMKSKTNIYRWQDEHGVWQFGEEPPANTSAVESVEIEDKITGLSRDWHGGGRRRAPTQPTMPIPGVGGLLQGKEMMEAAKAQVGNLNQRTEHLNTALKDIKARQ